jgi:hypothetical protein
MGQYLFFYKEEIGLEARRKGWNRMQAVKEAIPGFQIDLQAHFFQNNASPDRHTSRSNSTGAGGQALSPRDVPGATQRSTARDENITPNRYSAADNKLAAHSEPAPRVGHGAPQGVVANGGESYNGGPSGGVSAMTMSDVERMKVTSERIERLLASINNNPRNCGPALVQLKSAVRAVPEEVWQVRGLRPRSPCVQQVYCGPAL